MRMGINGEYIRIYGQAEIISREKIAGAWRNVERVVILQFDHNREFCRRLVCEIKSNFRLHLFRFATRLKMGIQDQVVAGIEPPGEAIGLRVGDRARFPEQKMADWIKDAAIQANIHPREAR